jgi:microcystin degradation protein MlrC
MAQGRLRIAVGGLLFEGNSLSPVRNGLETFRGNGLAEGEEVLARMPGTDTEVAGALSVLAATGDEPMPLIATHGGAGGRVTRPAWDHLRDALLSRLRAAGRLDGVYLALHGAMLCEGTDDPEGDLLEEVRGIVGDTPVAVSCDMHAHVTRRMAALSDILIGYRLYPHDDTHETGQRAAGLLLRALRGAIRPRLALCKAPMIVPAQRQRTRGPTPMRELYRHARAVEATGRVLALSYFPVQPWMDVEELGFAAVAIADGDQAAADSAAEGLATEAWRRRDEFAVEATRLDDAIREGLALQDGFMVLADGADCVGGGAAGDSAVVLARLLALAPEASAAVPLVDPAAAAAARTAGERAEIELRLGNRSVREYGQPVPVRARVVRLFDGDFTYRGGIMGGTTAQMGPSAWLRVGACDVVVASRATYEYGDEQFRAAGFDPRTRRFVVAKNPMNFQQAYAGAAAMATLDTPGPTTAALDTIPIPRAGRPLYPFDRGFTPRFAAERLERAR